MLKKSITYTDYNDEDVTEDFYFNFTKLEAMEMIELDDLVGMIEKLTKTQSGREAYDLFKKIILDAYGEKSEDGRRFIKSPEISEAFSQSPAFSEMIFEFLEHPETGAKFIEATLPQKLVQEALAAQAEMEKNGGVKYTPEQITEMNEEAARRQANPETAVLRTAPPQLEKKFEDYTHDELIEMPQEEFTRLVGTDVKKMTQPELLIAFERKNKI